MAERLRKRPTSTPAQRTQIASSGRPPNCDVVTDDHRCHSRRTVSLAVEAACWAGVYPREAAARTRLGERGRPGLATGDGASRPVTSDAQLAKPPRGEMPSAAAVSGQERHRSQLALIEQRPISWNDQRGQRRRVEHGHDNLPTGRGKRPASLPPTCWPPGDPGRGGPARSRGYSDAPDRIVCVHRIRPSVDGAWARLLSVVRRWSTSRRRHPACGSAVSSGGRGRRTSG